MKRIMAVLLVAAVSCWTVSLAGAETPEQKTKAKAVAKNVKTTGAKEKMMPEPDVQLKRLTEGLKLTPEQQQQIKPMLEDEYAQLKSLRKNEDLSPKQIRTKVEKLRNDTIAKIQTVLTPEQIERHNLVSKEIKANKQRRMQENRKKNLGTNADPPKQDK